jgi:hypothetical protein
MPAPPEVSERTKEAPGSARARVMMESQLTDNGSICTSLKILEQKHTGRIRCY